MITVLAHGTFDLLHPGHLDHLQQAAAMGDRLIVSITADRHVAKGPGRPILDQYQRVKMLKALRYVTDTYICDDPSAVPAIQQYRPDIYVRGPDYASRDPHQGKLAVERLAVESYGGRIAFTTGQKLSSTSLIQRSNSNGAVLERSAAEVIAWLDKGSMVDMAVLGEAIIDEYIYVEPAGKSPKENTITYRQIGYDRFDGGATAIARHMGIGASLSSFATKHEYVKKSRQVQKPFLAKVTSSVIGDTVSALHIPDVVPSPILIADYGHGFVRTKDQADLIVDRAGWIALMVQANSLNWGYNLLTKWKRANYFVADEAELRLASADRWTSIGILLRAQYERLEAKVGVVTLGHLGCLIYDGRDMLTLPALATKVVDRMGAGDAFLAWTARLAYVGAPPDIIGFVGNVAGGIQVGNVGNEKPVDRQTVDQWVRGLLS